MKLWQSCCCSNSLEDIISQCQIVVTFSSRKHDSEWLTFHCYLVYFAKSIAIR